MIANEFGESCVILRAHTYVVPLVPVLIIPPAVKSNVKILGAGVFFIIY